ncbi:MAG: caspase family protein [Rhodomicrobiaceae bacterium]
MVRFIFISLVALGFLNFTSSAFAETGRVALVIGNSAYQHTSPLDNPKNDALVMTKVLKELGFDVISSLDLSQNDMKRAIKTFAQKLEAGGRGTVGLFYYAGHGVQVGGRNYLIPVSAKISSAVDVEIESIDLEVVTNAMNVAGNGFNVVVLDACRDNPFKSSTRSLSRGLARINAPKGSLIAYATSPGDVAADGEGENSPYTAALVKTMQEPGLTIERVFKRVRLQVHEETKETQTPWESSSLTGDFYFLPEGSETRPKVEVEAKPKIEDVVEPGEVKPEERAPDAQLAYLKAVEDNTLDGYKSFLRTFPKHENAARVRQIIRSIADDKMWQRIKRLNKASGYRRYLAAFPDGDYKGEAKASLKSLQTTYVVPPKEIKKTRQFCGHPHGKWRVIDIRSDDVLNVRQGPSTRYPIVGAIPPNGSGVRRVECTSRNWCLVKYRCVSGWASGKYLTYNDRKPVGGSASKYYRVIDHTYPDKLNVRRGPGTKFGIVGRIPHNGKNVTVRQCKSIGSRKSRWCIVRWKSVSGWASGRYLANMSNGRRP